MSYRGMANEFTLKGQDVEISCTLGAHPRFPVLTYRGGSLSKDFLPSEILIDPTEIVDLVTVTLELDEGSTTFSLFLPTFEVPEWHSDGFSTIGVFRKIRRLAMPSEDNRIAWRAIHLHGTARTVEVPQEAVSICGDIVGGAAWLT